MLRDPVLDVRRIMPPQITCAGHVELHTVKARTPSSMECQHCARGHADMVTGNHVYYKRASCGALAVDDNSFAAFPEHAVFSQVAADLAAVVAGNPQWLMPLPSRQLSPTFSRLP